MCGSHRTCRARPKTDTADMPRCRWACGKQIRENQREYEQQGALLDQQEALPDVLWLLGEEAPGLAEAASLPRAVIKL